MSAYLILDSKIHDHAMYEQYKLKAKPIAEKYDGVYRARGGALEVVENDLWAPTRVVVIEFPSVERANAFVNSEEYAEVKPLRLKSSECTVLIVDGA